MSSNPLRLRRLFDKYARNACSSEELQELWTLMQEYADNDLLDGEMKTWWNQGVQGTDPAEMIDASKLFGEVLGKEKEIHLHLKQLKPGRKKIRRRWAAAAAIAVLLGAASYFWHQHKKTAIPELTASPMTHDVQAPQSNRAVITLTNGQLIYLDSSGNGTLAQQGNVKVVKLDEGKVTYSEENGKNNLASTNIQYNTLTNPRGSKVVGITLSDGSRIWLNAGSSLTYPVIFSGNERQVFMTGEAYFEVVHNSRKPFRIKAGNELIEDVGTKFNVSAYTDEPTLQTTLLEGAVKITLLSGKALDDSNKKTVLLKPGEQAKVDILSSGEQQIRVKHDVNVSDAVAWKYGRFRFSSVSIATIMREVARWYDVDIIYKGTVNGTLSGGISRTVNISGLLQMLELTGKVHFTVEGKNVIVQPVNRK